MYFPLCCIHLLWTCINKAFNVLSVHTLILNPVFWESYFHKHLVITLTAMTQWLSEDFLLKWVRNIPFLNFLK